MCGGRGGTRRRFWEPQLATEPFMRHDGKQPGTWKWKFKNVGDYYLHLITDFFYFYVAYYHLFSNVMFDNFNNFTVHSR